MTQKILNGEATDLEVGLYSEWFVDVLNGTFIVEIASDLLGFISN